MHITNDPSEWLKLPGLFYRFEIEGVLEIDGAHEYIFEPAGDDSIGRPLVAVYCRSHQLPPYIDESDFW
jgi:hypothetical protein